MTKKNKMWDNSNMQEDLEWGNIELPGCPDEVLLTKNWTKSRTDNNGMLKPGSKEKHQKSISERDSVWLNNVSKANKEKEKDPSFRNKRQSAIDKRTRSKDWIEKQKSNAKKKRKPVHTPAGDFESRSEAAKHHNMWPGRVSVMMEKDPDNWYYIK